MTHFDIARGVVAAIALTTMGCKMKLEATPTGPAPGAPGKIRVHLVGAGGAQVTCSAGACQSAKLPYSGEGDLDVTPPSGDEKTVVITAKKGIRRGSAKVDLGAGGTGATLAVNHGSFDCIPTGCRGTIALAPSSSVSVDAQAGTTIDIGGEKLTVPAAGSLRSPLKLALASPIEKQPLATICTGHETPSAVLGSTTITVTVPGKAPLSATAPLEAVIAETDLANALAEIAKGPVVFPWEKSGVAAKGKRAAVFVFGGSCYDAGASGATVADLDVIAIADIQTREDECVYHLSGGSGTATGKITLNDKNATAYDRITGRQLGTRLFTAPKGCDKEITLKGGSRYVAPKTSWVNDDDIAKWAATFAK